MDYADFYQRFGGSYRTKHVERGVFARAAARARAADLPRRVERWARRAVRAARSDPRASAGRLVARRTAAVVRTLEPPAVNRRPYRLPRRTGLPPEFIRLDPWEGEYLYVLASLARVGVVETGRLRGGSTFLLACANPRVPIFSVDISPKDDEGLSELMARRRVGANVELVVGDSRNVDYPEVGDIDLLFVDGDHSYDGCLADLRNWYPKLVPGGHVVLHDCYLGCEVQRAAIDFIGDLDVELIRPPYIHAIHWHNPTGSLAHFVKSASP
ncbi:MAG: hypothetical protein QOJ82_1617 [Solirubrobacteraceae bacterium]|jgi:predicted O-methyltransferase YrrM|nr:hypothetical protein [Solirubrobacteraceae bacterium]